MPRKGDGDAKARADASVIDAGGNRITDEDKLARIASLVIPPAWRDVWISPRSTAKLQATGVDNAGRVQYLYHPDFRAQQEQAKYDRLIQFAERLPDLRARRDNTAVKAALEDVRAAARGTQNLLVPMREALKRLATLGEVSDVLREEFGEYRPGG